MVAAHPVGAVLGHGQAVTETGLGGAGRVLLGGMPELKKPAMDRGVVHTPGAGKRLQHQRVKGLPFVFGVGTIQTVTFWTSSCPGGAFRPQAAGL